MEEEIDGFEIALSNFHENVSFKSSNSSDDSDELVREIGLHHPHSRHKQPTKHPCQNPKATTTVT